MSRSSQDQQSSPIEQPPRGDLAPLVRTVLSANPARSYRLGLAVGIAFAVATGLLVIQNGQSVRLTWLAWDFRMPLWLTLLLAVAAGAVLLVVGVALGMRARAHRAKRVAAGQRLRELAEHSHPETGDPAVLPDPNQPTPRSSPAGWRRGSRGDHRNGDKGSDDAGGPGSTAP